MKYLVKYNLDYEEDEDPPRYIELEADGSEKIIDEIVREVIYDRVIIHGIYMRV